MSIWTPPPLRQRLARPAAGTRNSQRGWVMAPYRYGLVSNDPPWANVVLLVDASNYANGSTPSTLDVTGKTPTYVGNAQIKTDNYAPITGATSSLYFDGTGDRVTFADSADWAMGSGDWTIEAWICPDFASGERYFLSQAAALGGFYSFLFGVNNSRYFFPRTSDGTTSYSLGTAGACLANTWRHVGASRYGNIVSTFVHGVYPTGCASNAWSGRSLMDSAGALSIGSYGPDNGSTYPWKGWVDQVRIAKGVGTYQGGYPRTVDGAYTVPTAPFPHS